MEKEWETETENLIVLPSARDFFVACDGSMWLGVITLLCFCAVLAWFGVSEIGVFVLGFVLILFP